MQNLALLVDHTERNGCKVALARDQEQFAAIEGGDGMMLLASRLGYAQLALGVAVGSGQQVGAGHDLDQAEER
jgi:hypothetical protein